MTDSGAVGVEVQSAILDVMQMFLSDQHLQEVALEALAALVADPSTIFTIL